MGLNKKKYLDYAGLEKLVDMHAVVPHPQVEITEEGAYKIAFDEHGHIVSKSPLTAGDLKLDKAMHFVGVSTTDPITGTVTIAGISNDPAHKDGFHPGDVCLYKRTKAAGDNGQGDYHDDDPSEKTDELYYEEYIYTGTAWELLGDASSYALRDEVNAIKVTAGHHLTGGGVLGEGEITLSHAGFGTAKETNVIKSYDVDECGHVKPGKDILVQSGGGHIHSHTVATIIAANTYITDVTDNHTKLSISPSKATVLTGIEDKLANLDTTSIRGVSGTTKVSKATAQPAVTVAKAGTEVVYGEANVGTEVTGLAKRAANTTKVGNANIATSATIIGNADVGDAVVYGTADVGTEITVDAGKADVGSATRYGTANVGEKVSVATQATAQTKVGNADVGAAIVYGTADVGAQITVDAGKADVGSKVTVATRASSQTTVGNANVATSATLAGDADVGTAVSVLNSFSNTAREGEPEATDLFHVSVVEATETLVLTPRIISTGNTNITPAVKTTTSIYGATSSNTKIYAVGGTTDITPAVASNRTVSFTPATAAPSTQTLTPAKAVSDASTKIYGVAGSIDITPAAEAPSTQTLTPATASNRTVKFTPAKAADTTRKLTPAKAATATIYGAVESTTEIYGVTADQVSIKPAVQSTKKIVPAVANGTITPYTFADIDVATANAAATTVATGSVSVGGAGAAIMTGTETTDTAVLNGATIVKGATGDVDVVDEVTVTRNDDAEFAGITDTHTQGHHTHILYAE